MGFGVWGLGFRVSTAREPQGIAGPEPHLLGVEGLLLAEVKF